MSRLFRDCVAFLVVLTSSYAGSVRAQTPVPTIDPELPHQDINPPRREPSLPDKYPEELPPLEELQPSTNPREGYTCSLKSYTPVSLPPISPPSKLPSLLEVRNFQFRHNTAFTSQQLAAKLDATVEELEKTPAGLRTTKPISWSRLLQIASEIASVYAESGYETSGAIISIPPSTPLPEEEVVEIEMVEIWVIEGLLEEMKIFWDQESSKYLNPNYICSRLKLAVSKPLKVSDLLEALQLLQLNPLIARVSANLSEGSAPGLSALEVEVTEAPPFNFQIIADNNRSPSIGSFERGGRGSEANLLGLGDKVDLLYTNTDGSNTIDTSYTIPINPRNGTLSFNYNYTDNDVIEPPFDRLDIESESSYYQLTLRQPIIQTINQQTQTFQEVALGLEAFWRESESFLMDNPFPLSPGANDDGRTRTFALRFLTEWTRQNARSVFALRSEMSLGLDAFGSTVNKQISGGETIPDSRFFAWRGQVQWLQKLLESETLLVLRGNIQLANDALLPSEEFSIGGFNSVRGYRQDALLTDNGFVASAEVRLPVLTVPEWQGVLQLIPFVDYGIGWNSAGVSDPDNQNLASVGLGLQWQQGDNFIARFDWGIPLVDIDSRDRTWQENGLLFSVQWNLF